MLQLQDNIIVIVTDGIAVAGAFAHNSHFNNLADLRSIKTEFTGLGVVQFDHDFRLLFRIGYINVGRTLSPAYHICQLLSVIFQLLDIAAAQTNLHRTAVTTAAALVGYNGNLQAFNILEASAQIIHNLLHAAFTLIAWLQADIQRALVNRITAVADIKRHDFDLRQLRNLLLQRLGQLYSFLQTGADGRFNIDAEFTRIICRLEFRTHKWKQQQIQQQRNDTYGNNLLRSFQSPGH